MPESSQLVISLLLNALLHIRSTPPRIIASPATQPRRASVALVIRIVPPDHYNQPSMQGLSQPTLLHFFSLEWVNDPRSRAEILFLEREQPKTEIIQNRPQNTYDAHVAFPGGRMEEGDESGLYTAMRQTWEEIGLDLAEKEFMCIGQLDDKEITTSLGKRLLMILSPFVFLQLSPVQLLTDPAPGTALHWTSLASLLTAITSSRHDRRRWTAVSVDISSRLAPKHSVFLRLFMRTLIGSMQFNGILLDPTSDPGYVGRVKEFEYARKRKDLKLWGLSLGMTLDLLSHMNTSSSFLIYCPRDEITGIGTNIAPSLTSVFPRFSYPDVNFWIWVFGRRYREVIRGWEASMRAGGSNDRRINWSGTALNTFYAAVRKALIVVVILRAIGVLLGVTIGGWWLFR